MKLVCRRRDLTAAATAFVALSVWPAIGQTAKPTHPAPKSASPSGAPARGKTTAADFGGRFERLAPEKRARIQEIIRAVTSGPDAPTPQLQQEFRSVAQELVRTPSDWMLVRDIVLVGAGEYQRMIFEDAREALKLGAPQRSPTRAVYEKRLQSNGMLTSEQIAESERTVERIQLRQPITLQGQQLVLEEPGLSAIIDSLAQTHARLASLFPEP